MEQAANKPVGSSLDAPKLPADSPLIVDDLVDKLEKATGGSFAGGQATHQALAPILELSVQESEFWRELEALHERLAKQHVAGKIRGVESWADGTDALKLVLKSWDSTIDKLYRMNVEENIETPLPPRIPTVLDKALGQPAPSEGNWITPNVAVDYIDDLVRTKFVVPFVDAVVSVSDEIVAVAERLALPFFKRYHAKDSGYHARHIYVVVEITSRDQEKKHAALEVKVLTKTQDTLGELTHLLYEKKRQGAVPVLKKRKLAWEFESDDFNASYVGHTSHLMEVMLVRLKQALHRQEGSS